MYNKYFLCVLKTKYLTLTKPLMVILTDRGLARVRINNIIKTFDFH